MRRITALLLLAAIACTSFGPVEPKEFVVSRRPLAVWVTTKDSAVVPLARPKFLGDTMVGFVDNVYRLFPPGEYVAVKASRPAPWRTIALVAGGIIAVTIAGLIVSGTGNAPVVPDSGEARVALP